MNYKIEVKTKDGNGNMVTITMLPFSKQEDMDSYWELLKKPENLMVFAGENSIYLYKMALSPMGNWELQESQKKVIS